MMCTLGLLLFLNCFSLKVTPSSDRPSLPFFEILAKDRETGEALSSLLTQIANSVLVHGRNEYASN